MLELTFIHGALAGWKGVSEVASALEKKMEFCTFGTAAWKTKFVTAEGKELILETTTINMSLLDSSALVCKGDKMC